MARHPVVIHKTQFIQILSPWIYEEFTRHEYSFDWAPDGQGNWQKRDTEIKEYCYKIPLSKNVCLKVYSTIDKETHQSRNIGKDSIKIVAAYRNTLKPVRPRFTHTYRLDTWKANFKKHISEALGSLGNNMKCDCGADMLLKRNRWGENFLACSEYSKGKTCRGRSIQTAF
jgi:ssDNA-binding Zn-finger/Zn-ribbon topoisomerase 1